MRLTIALEGNAEGRVLASIDMEDIVKMTVTDDIEKSNFNPQMLKSCTDSSYECGYQKGRADAIKEVMEILHEHEIVDCDNCPFEEKCNDDCWYVIFRELKEKNK